LNSWKNRCVGIASENQDDLAIEKYMVLRKEMAHILSLVNENASALDAQIQQQIDEFRGN